MKKLILAICLTSSVFAGPGGGGGLIMTGRKVVNIDKMIGNHPNLSKYIKDLRSSKDLKITLSESKISDLQLNNGDIVSPRDLNLRDNLLIDFKETNIKDIQLIDGQIIKLD